MIIGLAGLAMTVGMGRTILGPNAGFAARAYALLMAPFPIVTLFVFDRFASVPAQGFVRMTLFALLCLLYWPDSGTSISEIDNRVADGARLEKLIEQGVPISQLAGSSGPDGCIRHVISQKRCKCWPGQKMGVYRATSAKPPEESSVSAPLSVPQAQRISLLAWFRAGRWFIDSNKNGRWDGQAGGDTEIAFGNPGDIPFGGVWDARRRTFHRRVKWQQFFTLGSVRVQRGLSSEIRATCP